MATTIQTQRTDRPPLGRDDVLVEPEWLREHLSDPGVRLVEVDVSAAAYAAGHIAGAILWNVYADLKDAGYATVDALSFRAPSSRAPVSSSS